MKLLILSFYYPPDLCAGSFRVKALLEALKPHRHHGICVEVITTQPNRYRDTSNPAEVLEDHGWLKVRRIGLPPHKSGMRDQARAFMSYAMGVRKYTASREWDMVFATSSRLMTAALGAYVAHRLRLPLYLDIRDLFTDTLEDILAGSVLSHLLPAFRRLERNTLRRANRINVVSPGFIAHIRQIVPSIEPKIFTNGIDDEFLYTDFGKIITNAELPVILYAGNIGEGQGLHKIIPEAAKKLEGFAQIKIIGDGGRLNQLSEAIECEGLSNVQLCPPIARTNLLEEYRKADVLFLHLNNHPAFLKVLPSKIFEYAATGKPILAGLSGFAESFVCNELPGVSVFSPCSAEAMVKAFHKSLNQSEKLDRRLFCEKYDRKRIMAEFALDILATIPQRLNN